MINKIYYNQEITSQIRNVLEKEGAVQLNEFLTEEGINFFLKKREQRKLKRYYIPLLASYEYANFSESNLGEEIKEVIEKILGREIKIKSLRFLVFYHKDYTLISDTKNEEEGYTLLLELTEYWKREFGGYTSFVKNNEELQRIYPIPNSLSLIKTDKSMKSFTKYVNHEAKDEKRTVLEIKFFSIF